MNGKVFRSIDGGASWIKLGKELSNTQVTSLTGSTTFLYISTDVGIFRSADAGDSWKMVNDRLKSANVLAVLGRDLYAGTNSGVFRSIDGGESWTEINGLTTMKINA